MAEVEQVSITWVNVVAMYDKITQDYSTPRASLLQCGCDVPDRLLQTIWPDRVTYPADPLSVDRFAGIPIVTKADLLPDQWQLVDQFGDVLYAGSLPDA